MTDKKYEEWNKQKVKLNARIAPQFREREIWWCSVGVNIGFEEDGKNDKFERPVCIFRKFNKDSFIGIPLTSAEKDDKTPFYMNYVVNEIDGSLILSQIRLMSSNRLNRHMSTMNKTDFKRLQSKIQKLLFKGESPSG